MAQPKYDVILLQSTSHAMRVEKLLHDAGIGCKMIPVPRHIGTDCGVCIRICHQDLDAARCTVQASGIEVEGICTV